MAPDAGNYQVLVPNTPPLTGHSPTGDSYDDLDSALEAAKVEARSTGRLNSVLVQHGDSEQVWSVQWHPEPARVGGINPVTGEPAITWPVEYRIVTDHRVLEQEFEEDGTETRREWVGAHDSQDEVPVEEVA